MPSALLSPTAVSNHAKNAARSPLDLVKEHINSQLAAPDVSKVDHHAGTFYSLEPIWVPLSEDETLQLSRALLKAGWTFAMVSVRDGGAVVHVDSGLQISSGCIYDGRYLPCGEVVKRRTRSRAELPC